MDISTSRFRGADEGLSDPNDPILKGIEEATGVHLVPQNVAGDDSEQKIQPGLLTVSCLTSLPSFVAKSFYGNWIEQGGSSVRCPMDLSAYPNLAEHMKWKRAQGSAAMVSCI